MFIAILIFTAFFGRMKKVIKKQMDRGTKMSNSERRSGILEILHKNNDMVTASQLAAEFGVSRQVIVSDIALLRAKGYPIAAERRGYFLKRDTAGIYKTVICCHDAEHVLEEFYAVVDHGGKVLDVIVEHPVYGQISANLNIASRYDAEEFVRKVSECHASQLCDLTDGLHIHTLLVPDEAAFVRIYHRLTDLGFAAAQ